MQRSQHAFILVLGGAARAGRRHAGPSDDPRGPARGDPESDAPCLDLDADEPDTRPKDVTAFPSAAREISSSA
jgi:hypothetical protein